MKKLLAIDDKKDNLVAIEALVKNFIPNCTVITAQSGAAGIIAARQELPDTILLDLIMPDMDGYEVCQRLKNDNLIKHIPVILITAISTDTTSRIKGLENGADAFLTKPIDPVEFSAQVNVMLRIKSAEDKLRDKNVNLEALVAERTNELKASEEQFRHLVEQSPLAIQIMDTAGYINQVNLAFMTLWNISRIGLHQVYEKYNLLDDKQLIAAGVMPLINKAFTGEVVTLPAIEYNVLNMMENLDLTKREGNRIWIQLRLFPIKNSNGEVINIVQISEDITERRQSEIEINKLLTAVEQSPAVIAITDLNGNLEYVNPKFTEVTGYTSQEAIGQNPKLLKSGEFSAAIYHKLWETIYAGKVWHGEFHNKKKNGDLYWELATVGPIFGPQGKIISFIKIAEDITKRKQAESELQKSKQKIEDLHEVASYLVRCEAEADVYRMSIEAAEKILGFHMASLSIAENDILVEKSVSCAMLAIEERKYYLNDELAAKAYNSGETITYGCLTAMIAGKPLRPPFKSGIVVPIDHVGVFQVAALTEKAFSQEEVRLLELLIDHIGGAIKRIRLQKELKKQATLDPLTNVYNRRYFNRVIEQEISRSKRYKHQIGFMMIDIDNFKQINDTKGHETGDRILQKVAKLLVEQVRGSDIVIRYGGDEFLIVLIQTDTDNETIRQRIIKTVEEHNIDLLGVSVSIGAVNWQPKDKTSLAAVLAEADRRMYTAKKRKMETGTK